MDLDRGLEANQIRCEAIQMARQSSFEIISASDAFDPVAHLSMLKKQQRGQTLETILIGELEAFISIDVYQPAVA